MPSFKIGTRLIGHNAPIFIIAEAGINHAGSFSEALEMVEVAHQSHADAVSFQHISWQEINSQPMPSSNIDLDWDHWHLSNDQMQQLFNLAHEKGLAVTACVVSQQSLDLIVKMGADFIKVVSGDLTCHPFLTQCAKTGLPIFLSTGNAVMSEIGDAVKVIETAGCFDIVVYQTNSIYPTPPDKVDLKSLDMLRSFQHPVGFCDHTEGSAIALAASALGATVIEKHFSLNPALIRPDAEVSLSPTDLEKFVTDIRIIEKALGRPQKIRYSRGDDYLLVRRSIVAAKNLGKGHVLKEEDLDYKRPGTGIPPSNIHKIIGHSLRSSISMNEQITYDILG